MDGSELIDEFSKRLKQKRNIKTITDSALARALGITQPALIGYRKPTLTPRQIVNLMEKFQEASQKILLGEIIVPIVEFLPITRCLSKQSKKWEIFSAKTTTKDLHPYLGGLQEKMAQSSGIYMFYDSRGRAIYVGKAQKQSLWAEMNAAFNRKRGAVQKISRVRHPTNRIAYQPHEEKKRKILSEQISLHEIAHYVSAYKINGDLIGKFEAVIIRSLANDLLNVKMENF